MNTYCTYFNEIGKRCKQQGLSFGYHNHAHEFQKVEDKVMYDYMLEHTNPEYVFFQMDLYWVVADKTVLLIILINIPAASRYSMLRITERSDKAEW